MVTGRQQHIQSIQLQELQYQETARHQILRLLIQALQETAILPVRTPIREIIQQVHAAVVRQYRIIVAEAVITRVIQAAAVHGHQVLPIREEAVQVVVRVPAVQVQVVHAVHPEVEAVETEDNFSATNF